MEKWKLIVDGLYEVSDRGRVRRVARITRRTPPGGIVAQHLLDGYRFVRISFGVGRAARRTVPVHSLVAEAFIGPRPASLEVNHRNGIKRDNRPENLEYVSHAQNMAHAKVFGLCKGKKRNRSSEGASDA